MVHTQVLELLFALYANLVHTHLEALITAIPLLVAKPVKRDTIVLVELENFVM